MVAQFAPEYASNTPADKNFLVAAEPGGPSSSGVDSFTFCIRQGSSVIALLHCDGGFSQA